MKNLKKNDRRFLPPSKHIKEQHWSSIRSGIIIKNLTNAVQVNTFLLKKKKTLMHICQHHQLLIL